MSEKRTVHSKVNSLFHFPTELHIDASVLPCRCDGVYQLASVFMHEGTPCAGHYYSYSFVREQQEWFVFNDSEVEKVDASTVMCDGFGSAGLLAEETKPCRPRGSRLGLKGGMAGRTAKKQASAYLLLYVLKECSDTWQQPSCVETAAANDRLFHSLLTQQYTDTIDRYLHRQACCIRITTLSTLQRAHLDDFSVADDFVPRRENATHFVWRQEVLTKSMLTAWGKQLGIPTTKQVMTEIGGDV